MADNCPPDSNWQLLVVIADHGQGSRVLRLARESGISGGTILLGHGTARHRQPEWQEGYEPRREIILLIADQETAAGTLKHLNRSMRLGQPRHGIAFMVAVAGLIGSQYCPMQPDLVAEGAKDTMLKAIVTIVDLGLAESVVEAAEEAGAPGATVVHARGAGRHETSHIFAMAIEPEKEVVIILAAMTQTEAIMQAIRKAAHLDEPGRGLLFLLDVNQAYGLAGQN